MTKMRINYRPPEPALTDGPAAPRQATAGRLASIVWILVAVLSVFSAETAQAASANPRKATYAERYLTVDPVQVAVVNGVRLDGSLFVEFNLDVPKVDDRGQVTAAMPRLRDAWLQTLNRYAWTELQTRQAPNAPRIRALLQYEADRLIGAGATDVLLMNLMVRSRIRQGAPPQPLDAQKDLAIARAGIDCSRGCEAPPQKANSD